MTGSNGRRALFLDRDGTINFDYHYMRDPGLVHFFPSVSDAVKAANDAGYFVAVITNQSGVNRGLIKLEELEAVNHRIQTILAAQGAHIDAWGICPHTPEEKCNCRKPKPKLLLDLAREHKLDLSHSLMVGDRLIDVMAGKAAGCKAALVRTGNGLAEEKLFRLTPHPTIDQTPDYIVDDLLSLFTQKLL